MSELWLSGWAPANSAILEFYAEISQFAYDCFPFGSLSKTVCIHAPCHFASFAGWGHR